MNEKTQNSFPFSACCMLALLCLGGIMGLLTLFPAAGTYDKTPHHAIDVVRGAATKAIEKNFEDTLPIRQAAIDAWTAFTSSIFHTAGKDVRIGKDGWYYTTEEFQYFPDGKTEINKKLQLISDISAFLSKHNIALIVALLPAKARIYPEHLYLVNFPSDKQSLYSDTLTALNERGILAPDLLPAYQELKQHQLAFPRTETHWSPAMAAEVAKILAATVKEKLPTLSLPKKEFHTMLQPEETYLGDLPKRMVPTGIFKSWIGPFPETLVRQKTEEQAKEDNSLFAEETIPIVLVGTSYSAGENWNFDGALKTAFQADVLNMAVKGRGPLFPLDEFFKTTDFDHAPPELVIWEIPERSLEVAYDHEKEIPITLQKLRAAGVMGKR